MQIPTNIWIVLPVVLAIGGPLLGLLVGMWIDKDHRENLAYRRRQVGHVLVTDLRTYPGIVDGSPTEMLVGETVLSCNAFRAIIGRLKMLFGGEVRSYYDVMTRARQEVVLRVMETAAERGYDAVCNLRVEAVDISGQTVATRSQQNKAGLFIGLIACATAYRRAPGLYPPPAPPTLMDYPQ